MPRLVKIPSPIIVLRLLRIPSLNIVLKLLRIPSEYCAKIIKKSLSEYCAKITVLRILSLNMGVKVIKKSLYLNIVLRLFILRIPSLILYKDY